MVEETRGEERRRKANIDQHKSYMQYINRVQTRVHNTEHCTIHQRLMQHQIKPAVKVMIMEA